ncbi:G-protein coupled receptor Mth-like [Drosophila rhopaloa]|uniref:G-protein coupled receptor Mth-like n=1 Tax=Drosophila rhopaloa TaxID=1041015 RepID=A0A6P4DYP1_DRORH|nr:G-protein coupled receptor Mth-like [Drosophila rhopaloa]
MPSFLGLFCTVLLLIVNCGLQKTNAEILGCDFYDTIDISSSRKLPSGSYIYEDLVIPLHLTGEYDYKVLPDNSKKKVTSHLRGCVCKLKPCVRFCCPFDHIMYGSLCYDDMTMDELDGLDPFLNVTLDNGSVVKRHFKTELIVQSDLPIPSNLMYLIDNRYEGNEYTLFENGTFLRHYDNEFINKREYCLQHLPFKNGNKTSIRIVPYNCLLEPPKNWRALVLVLSLICLIFTISVYLFIEKLRNFHGKCFICYMVSLSMAYLLLFLNWWDLSFGFCETAGFMGYFFIMSTFFWLSVISRHLWKTISEPYHSANLPKRQFLVYNIFAWGTALVLTGVTFIADQVVENKDWSPRVREFCWIDTRVWSAVLYLVAPIQVLFLFNTTMFILTVLHIIKVRRDIEDFTQYQKGAQKLSANKPSYTFFLRIFIMMGVSWSLEIFSFLVQGHKLLENIFVVTSLFNWSQGIIIFVLFVLKKSTLRLLKKRLYSTKVSRWLTGNSFNQESIRQISNSET